MRVIGLSTVVFALVLIHVGLATAFVKAHNPSLSIISIILGSFGYTYGSLLGIFMVGLFTKTRGNVLGNVVAMAAGIVAVSYLSNLPNAVWSMVTGHELYTNFECLPVIEFTWRVLAGILVMWLWPCVSRPQAWAARMRSLIFNGFGMLGKR